MSCVVALYSAHSFSDLHQKYMTPFEFCTWIVVTRNTRMISYIFSHQAFLYFQKALIIEKKTNMQYTYEADNSLRS